MSLNCNRTSRMLSSLARRSTSRLLIAILMRIHQAYRQSGAQRELVLRRLQVGLQDLCDLIEPVEDRVAMHRQALGRLFDVLADLEVQLERFQQVGFMLAVVGGERIQQTAGKLYEGLAIRARVQQGVDAEIRVHRDRASAE